MPAVNISLDSTGALRTSATITADTQTSDVAPKTASESPGRTSLK